MFDSVRQRRGGNPAVNEQVQFLRQLAVAGVVAEDVRRYGLDEQMVPQQAWQVSPNVRDRAEDSDDEAAAEVDAHPSVLLLEFVQYEAGQVVVAVDS